MPDTEITPTSPQQPRALRIAKQLRDMASRFKTPSHERGVCNAAIQELDHLHAENEALREQLENSRKAHDTSGFVNAMQYAHGIGKSMS